MRSAAPWQSRRLPLLPLPGQLRRASTDAATLAYDTHLDYFVADSAIECHRDHLVVGDRLVKVLSMKEPPSHTFAQPPARPLRAAGRPHRVPGVAADPGRPDAARLQARRRHFFNKRVSLVNYVAPDTRPEEMLVDDSATAPRSGSSATR